MAPGKRTVLCSYGYFRRASTSTGDALPSSCCLRSSFEIRGTGTRLIVVARSPDCQRGVVTGRAHRTPLIDDLPLPIEALTGDAARERDDAPALPGYEGQVGLGDRRLRARRFVMMAIERPSRRSTATMDAPQKNGPGLTPHPVLVAAG